jgi:hypothetical protein
MGGKIVFEICSSRGNGFKGVTLYSASEEHTVSIFRVVSVESGDATFLQNICKFLTDYMGPHPRK